MQCNTTPPSVEFIFPVLNEERTLPPSTAKLHAYLSQTLDTYDWRIIIVDNGSTDSTLEVALHLSQQYERVGYIRLEERGRGRAVTKAWIESDADILCYMDVDLSSELTAIPKLLMAIEREGYDIAIGSRLAKGAMVFGRPIHREFISRAYSLMFRTLFFTIFKDAQCGLKAISAKAARELLPLVEDTGWFFDTELLILAADNGYLLKEIPVRWIDDPDSRVKIVKTAYADIRGLLRLRFGGLKKASNQLKQGQSNT